MVAIRLRGFSGEVPKVDPFYLPDSAAAEVMNASLQRGSLSPFRSASPQEFEFSSQMQSIYLMGAEWLGWNHPTDVAPGPVATDRLYITHQSTPPTMWLDGNEVPLRMPNPSTRPSITLPSGATVDEDLAESILYAYTWVTSLGEETGPSPLSNRVKWSPGISVTINDLPSTPPVANRFINGKRIYRAVTSASGVTDLYYVAQISAAAVTYIHNLETAPIAEAITTKDFDPAPSNLRGITAMPNGIMAGFAGKVLYFCEPFQPHAWPMAYSQTLTDTIIGLAAFGTTLAVLTTGQPYIVQGMHPDSMAMQKMEQPFPCMSKRGIVDMGYQAIYPSTDGLVAVSEGGAQLISKSLWTREQWLAMQPTTMIAGRFGSYYGFTYTPTSGSRHLVLIDTSGGDTSVLRSDEAPLSIYTHIESGRTFFLGSDRITVRAFDSRTQPKKTFRWRSKPYRLPYPQSFGAMRIDTDRAAGETVTARVFDGAGQLIHSANLANADLRFPAGSWDSVQVELAGNATVLSFVLAQSFADLANA